MRWFTACVVGVGLASCVGTIGDPSSESPPDRTGPPAQTRPTEFECGNDQYAEGELERLSREQYHYAVRDLFEPFLGGSHPEVWSELETLADRIPEERTDHHMPFAVMNQSVTATHVTSYLEVAQALAQRIAEGPAMETLTQCASDPTAACVERFAERFAALAYGRPLDPTEMDFLMRVYDAPDLDPEGLADVITVVLNAPQFIYRVEHGAGETGADVYALSEHEVAKRLAAVLWQSIPDEALLASAESGELLTEEGFATTVDRMLEDRRFERATETFVREWFQLGHLGDFSERLADARYRAFAGELMPDAGLRQAMIGDIAESFRWHAQQGDGFSQWFESERSFATHPQLAEIYGVPMWDGTSEPPTFPSGERAGLITRAALVATAGVHTRPILKGVTLRRLLLCDELAPPPPDVDLSSPPMATVQTTREATETLTETPGSACVSCHGPFINHLGFPTESYDSLGRFRTEETIYDDEGNIVATLPIDTSAVPRARLDDEAPVANAADLARRLSESEKLEACFARQLFRYTRARAEEDTSNGCALEETRTTAPSSIRDALLGSVSQTDFRNRLMLEVSP